jgi:hypothetical protein
MLAAWACSSVSGGIFGLAALATWLKGRGKPHVAPDLRRADEAESRPFDALKARDGAFRIFDETAGKP